jgi:ADP-heptose:LPS heptosyltransferase
MDDSPHNALRAAAADARARNGIDSVLVAALGRLGDVLCMTAVVAALKKANPDWRITVLSDIPVLWDGSPSVDTLIPADRGAADAAISAYLSAPGREPFDLAVLLNPERPGASGPIRQGGARIILDRFFITTEHERVKPFPSLYNDGSTTKFHVIEQQVSGLHFLGVAPPPWPMQYSMPPAARDRARALLSRLGLPAGAALILYNVGTHQSRSLFARRMDRVWPIPRFVDCARILMDRRPSPPLHFLLHQHSLRDKWMAFRAARALPRGRCFRDPDDIGIPVLGALLLESKCLITPDTGTQHLAAALGVNTVSVYGGRMWPEYTGPYLPPDRRRIVLAPEGPDRSCAKIPGSAVAEAVLELIQNS